MSSTDVESLQPIVRHRNKCVYASLACLAFAVVATSLSGAAMFVVVWRELQTQTELINNHINSAQSMNQDSPSFAPHTSLPEEGMFKSGHLAYLRATSANISNHTMDWEGIDYGSGSSIGTNFALDKLQRRLTVTREGSYFIYLNLRFKSATFKSATITNDADGMVKVILKSGNRELLTCEVKLTQGKAVQEKCWAVAQHLESKSHISADMIVHGSHYGWGLVSNESGFGMFLVDSL